MVVFDRKVDSTIRVKLNVGGVNYQTTVDTLTKVDSMLSAMFSKRFYNPKNGQCFIDRDGRNFGVILNLFRNGEAKIGLNTWNSVQYELKYYCIDYCFCNKGNRYRKYAQIALPGHCSC